MAAVSSPAQVALASGSYVQNFDSIGSGLPAGWTVTTGATASSLGSAVALNTTATSWATSTGQFANFAAADNDGAPFTGTEAVATQSAATDRALGLRQTGAVGDPGAAINFNFSTVGQQVTSISFLAQMLSVQTRSTIWSVQYGVGAAPSTWTTLATYSDPGVFGSTTINLAGFGPALDNQASAWIRVVALTVSTGSGSRDTFGIDDFTIVTSATSSATPPSITTSPSSQTVTEGATVQFAAAATGTDPLTYQWRKNTVPLADGGIVSGSLTPTLTLAGVAVSDDGSYDVVVSNAGGSAASDAATLTVMPLVQSPAITTNPSSVTVAPGASAGFSVVVTGSAPLTYQWRRNGAALSNGGSISGADAATLAIDPVAADDLGSYDVVVTNTAGSATSSTATLAFAAVVTPAGDISYAGGTYAQSFDTLPASGTFTLPSAGPLSLAAAPINASGLGGWSLAKYSGSGTLALFKVDNGGSNSGSIYSYGSASSGDRALGSVSSGTTISRFGASLVNSTGRTITSFALSYSGEQWRRGSAAANKLTFEYSTAASDINTGTFTAAPALDFVAPVITGTSIALDGNAAADRARVSGTISGVSWAPGTALIIRWTDVDDTGSDDGLAIDDLSFSTAVGTDDLLPAVVYTTPSDGEVNVPIASTIDVAFNEPVNFASDAVTLVGSESGAHGVTVSGGPSDYTLTPDLPFAEGEVVTLTLGAAQITDAATGTQHPEG
ncbi:MAG TPA: immunoglobulin domain-containing protein, partial [Candidatus Didemnitutus sp.]